jgi:hypothetical protein
MKKTTKTAASNKATKTNKSNGISKGNGKSASPTKADAPGFLHVAMAKRSREGLNKLVDAMEAPGQRQVLEQLIADELHRRGMRLPRAA